MIVLKCTTLLLLSTLLTFYNGKASKHCRRKDYSDCGLPADTCDRCPNPSTIKYRTIDGTCNHQQNLGAASGLVEILLPPEYDDGVDSPRQRGVDGQPLPNVRRITLKLHPEKDVPIDLPITVMQWGEWTTHDVVAVRNNLEFIDCCGPNGGFPPIVTDRNCDPIEVPRNDPALPGVCMSFARANAANGTDCLPKRPRRQINSVTSFFDCSQIYGSTDDVATRLRVPGGFLLRTKRRNFPPEAPSNLCIIRNNTDDYCFLAGDVRSNQHTYLSAMHTLWLREHNYIATKLKELKPDASNENIFQTARRIIIAMHQVITYNTYLPIILGDDAELWKLTSKSGRSYYDPSINPSVSSAFSVGANRFGHSITPSLFPIGNRPVLSRFLGNSPGFVLDDFDGIIAGMLGLTSVKDGRIQASDRFVTEELTNIVFVSNGSKIGRDLVSIDIARGRDHGLPAYVKWRSFCGLRPLTGFNDTKALGPYASDLGKLYRSVEDIDLNTGMSYEPVKSGIVGPTIACLLRIQFHRSKYGDRFFFDNTEPNSGFTDAQLASLRKVTLSQVMCRHTSLKRAQRNAFQLTSRNNPLIPCTELRTQGVKLSLFV